MEFSLSYNSMTHVRAKARLSAVGILNYDGANELYRSVIELTNENRKEKELIDNWIQQVLSSSFSPSCNSSTP